MAPETEYIVRILPALIALGLACFFAGGLVGAIFWLRGRFTARRIQRQCDRYASDIRKLKRLP